ncbi:MAG: FAD-dependent thymidylate synthase, partial [Acidobacteriota bacterium]|nr:FAD-dependent thymidylate synthase [Acidobacteriota bacterium]
VLESPVGARYVGDMDRMFDTYRDLLPVVQAHLTARFPQQAGDSDFVYRQSVRAKALDALRGLLPAASLSNVGIYGSGQAYEMLLLRMRAHPLPEAGRYAEMMLEELRKVIPSFLQRVDTPSRGGAWSDYLARTRQETEEAVGRLWPEGDGWEPGGAAVRLLDYDPDGEAKVLAAMAFPFTGLGEEELLRRARALSSEGRQALFRAYVGERTNRRHRPGRAFERTDYRFEIVSDYGAFRDLQRHRMLTIEWQPLGTGLGYEVPELVADAGVADQYEASMVRSAELHDAVDPLFPEQAAYAVALGFRMRYVMQLNAREAMHLIELRSGQQGHPAYRAVAQQMHRSIAEVAGHRGIAEAMTFVDHDLYDLERIEAERRAEARRQAAEVRRAPV